MPATCCLPWGGDGVEVDRELMLEDDRSIREAMRRMARLAQDAAEALDARIEEEDLNGRTEAEERLQALSFEVREQLDDYQDRHAR